MNFFQKMAVVWQKVGLVQRALLMAVVLTFVIVGGFLVHWVRQPDMRMLYQDLVPEEAGKITDKISEKGTSYELRNGGTSIYVPQEQVYQLRLDMAKEGLPTGGQGGYKIFDNEKIGVSPFVQNVNLKRALQDELAMSIQMIDGVAHARVHIVSTEQTLFTSDAGTTSASVVLKVRPGYQLSGLNIAAITHLVAGSVEGLQSENVTVIDSEGRLLSSNMNQGVAGGAGTVMDYKERVEQNLENKVKDMLTAVLGPGRATVKVSAVVDMNSTNVVTESYSPSKRVAKKEEIKSNSEIEGTRAPAAGEPAVQGGTKKDETILTEYAVGKIVEQKIDLAGEIKSLSVAAFVDLTAADANEVAGESTMIMQVSDVEEIIKSALGLKSTDSLKVVQVKFHRPTELLTEEEPSKWPRYTAIARQASLGIMAICAFLVLRIFSGAKKKAASSAASPAQLPKGEVPMGLPGTEAGGSEPLALRQQIAGALESNPEQVKQLFTSWLEQKE